MATNILGSLIINLLTKADTTGLNKTDRAIQKTTKSLKNMSKTIGNGFLSNLGKKLFSAVDFGGMLNNYIQFEKDIGAIHSRFYAVTGSNSLAEAEYEWVKKLSKQTAINIKSVADSYSIFYAAAQRPLGQENAREIFEDWTKISRVLHLNEEQFDRVTYALREMSSKGQLYSQDLKIQLGTHVPDAVNIAETAIKNLGIAGIDTVDAFQKFTKMNPKSGMMGKFLLEFSREATRRYGSEEALKEAMKKPDAIISAIKGYQWRIMEAFSKAGGGQMLIGVLQGIEGTIKSIDWNFITTCLGFIGKIFGVMAQFLPQIMWTLSAILRIVAMHQIAKFFGLMGNTFKLVRAIFSGGKGLFTAIRGMLKFGSIGEIITSSLLAFGKGGLKTALTGALGLTGPLGWLVTSLLWLPEIVKVVKWIAKKMGLSKEGDIFTQHGTTAQQAYNILKKVSENKDLINDPIELQKQLGYYKGGEALAGNTYYDNGQIVLNFDGNILTLDDIKNMANEAGKQIEDKRKKSNTNWFNRPNLTEQEKNTKNIRGY